MGIPVSNIISPMGGTVPQAGAPIRTEEAAEAFQKVMTKVTDDVMSMQTQSEAGTAKLESVSGTDAQSRKEASAAGKKNPVRDASEKADGRAEQKNTAANAEKVSGQEQQKLQESGEKLVEDIADEMGVSTEEVTQAMEVLGLSVVDLFDLSNLKQLLLQISGNTDEMSLVTDADLYQSFQMLSANAEESLEQLGKELGLDAESLNALIEEMASEQDGNVAEAVLEGLETGLEGSEDYEVTVRRNGEAVKLSVTVENESGEQSVKESAAGVSEDAGEAAEGQKLFGNAARSGRQEERAGADQSGNLFQMARQEMTAEPQNTVQETAAEQPYQSAQSEEIMDQILDYMKIHLKAESQELEMQLHPSSLGTVNVQVIAKGGSITAQFTTQNEAVRAAVESQLIELKQQFEEQGIKVDKVEVAVASHQEGQQFSQSDETAKDDQKGAGRTHRRLNLEELDAEGEAAELETSERIAVEMMRANGGTVDYTA